MIVIFAPGGQLALCVRQREEDLRIQTFVPQTPVKALDVSILDLGFALRHLDSLAMHLDQKHLGAITEDAREPRVTCPRLPNRSASDSSGGYHLPETSQRAGPQGVHAPFIQRASFCGDPSVRAQWCEL